MRTGALSENNDFILKNDDFLLKNVDFIIQQTRRTSPPVGSVGTFVFGFSDVLLADFCRFQLSFGDVLGQAV